jgi:hypothetical protein
VHDPPVASDDLAGRQPGGDGVVRHRIPVVRPLRHAAIVPTSSSDTSGGVAFVPHRGHEVHGLEASGYRRTMRSWQFYGDRPGSSRVGRAA